MNTLIEQIKSAKRAYIVHLNPHSKGFKDRYSVYLDNGDGQVLSILWPRRCDNDKLTTQELLAADIGMSYHARNTHDYPAYHFVLNGGQYNKPHELGQRLRAHNDKLEIYTMGTGYAPSLIQY